MDGNILIIAGSLESGLVDGSVVDVAVVLSKMGWGVSVASAGGRKVKELKKAGVEHIQLPVNSTDWFVQRKSVSRLADFVRSGGVRLVHAFTPAAARLAFRLEKAAGVPYVASFVKVPSEGFLARLLSPLKYLARGKYVIVPSEYMAGYVQANWNVGSDRIIIIPQWIDTDVLNPANVSAARIISVANSLRIPEDKFIVASVSGIEDSCGHSLMLQALARLPDDLRDDVRVLLIGGCRKGRKAELERLAARLGVDSLVHVVGEIQDMAALLMLSDVFVALSDRPKAAYPRLLEAQALGRPIVACGVGATGEYLLEGGARRLFEPKSADSLAGALAWSMGIAKDSREDISRRLASHIRMNFSRAHLPAKIGSIYDYVLGGGK